MKLQLWDTAGTERFRSVSRSYYRGAAGAILLYDVASHNSFSALPTFLMDARALASPNLTVLLAGNKTDLAGESPTETNDLPADDPSRPPQTASSSVSSKTSTLPFDSGGSAAGSVRSSTTGGPTFGNRMTATTTSEGREVWAEEATRWASKSAIPVAVEVSALSGENVDEMFSRLARMILTKIELGEIDPDDPQSGIQYGDGGAWGMGTSTDGGSVKSGMTVEDGMGMRRRGKRGKTGGWGGMREWEEVFRVGGSGGRSRGKGCC
jgi:GTPase SAR1 family protein